MIYKENFYKMQKFKYYILFTCFFVLSLTIFGQNLKIVNTKDLIGISKKYGLNSALEKSGVYAYYLDVGRRPVIFDIDDETTRELIKHIKNNKPSKTIEAFLVAYALCVQNPEMATMLYDYFDREKDELINYNPVPERNLSLEMSQNSLFALIENPLVNTDSLLFKYYELWNQKIPFYLQYYQQGLEEKDRAKQETLMKAYEQCNYNCYILQRFLKQMESPLYDQEKMEYHQKNLVSYLRNGFAISKKEVKCSGYENNNIFKTIKLSKNYNFIGDINFKKELKWKELIRGYNKTHCGGGFLMFNGEMGYLSLSCYYDALAAHGVSYKLELKGNKLIIYRISSWVS